MLTSARNLAQRAYEQIQHNILSGTLPSGSVISEATLARQLGISRTPVGEAIRQLANDGLVRQVPRYGTIVRALSPGDLAEQYEMREAMESYAAARAAERISPDAVVRLGDHCEAMQRIGEELGASGLAQLPDDMLRRFLAADLAFHVQIIEAAGNRRILKAVQDMRAISRIIGMSRVPHDADIVSRACAHHALILNALAAGDPESARRHMAEHIRSSKNSAIARLKLDLQQRASMQEISPELIEDLNQIEQSGRIEDSVPPTGGSADAAKGQSASPPGGSSL